MCIALFQGPELPVERAPASVAGDCFNSIKLFLGKRSVLTKTWSKFKQAKSGYKLDMDKLDFYREEYARGIGEEGIQFRDVKPTSESLLAYIEAINKNFKGDHVPDLRKMDYFSRKKVANIVEIMNSDGKLLMNDIEELVGDLYLAAYGPSMKANEVLFEDHIEKRVLARVLQEDLASRGLSNVFFKYKIFAKKKTWAQKFVRSNFGRTLGTGILNLPVLYGFPPIFLPKLKPIKIPNSMVDDLVMNGLTDEMVKKLEQEIGRQLGDKVTFNLQNRARYRLFRRYYMAGISIYLTYMAINEFYETNNMLKEEATVLNDLADGLTDVLDQAVELEAKGYDIFDKSADISDTKDSDKDNRWCKAIKQCLESEAEELSQAIEKGSESYKACKEFMDPENLCSSM